MSDRWDNFYLRMALESARMSKDPSTKVGCVLVGKNRSIIATGFNGFPAGVADTADRLHDRDKKLELVVHAEMNAVLMAARLGIATDGATCYVAATDDSQEIWGGPPCLRCAVECMQAGIREYVSWPTKPSLLTNWADSIAKAKAVIEEAGLVYRTVPFVSNWCTPDAELGCAAHQRNNNRCRTCPLDKNMMYRTR